jgi:quinolinate synthase
MINARQLIDKKKELPGYAVVTYVNSTAEVKAESDICCTSANADRVVQSLGTRDVLFVPDQYLGAYTALKTGKKMEFWPGYCPTHARIRPEDILRIKKEHPQAVVVVHPECRPETSRLADQVLSTGGMLRFARCTDKKEIVVATEVGIIYRLRKENPDKVFIAASEQAVCPRMKLITLEKILDSLESLSPVVKVPEPVRVRAKIAVDRMLQIV